MNPPRCHPAALDVESLLAECQSRRLRRGGPGGQHRNKVETAWWVQHRPTGVEAEAGERRCQAENRRVALFRLRVNLALEVRCERDVDSSPSALWRSRRRGGRIHVGAGHDDFPAMLAEALDEVSTRGADVAQAAARLGCTTSQLVRLLKKDPRAMGLVNRWREAAGLRPLR